MAAITAKRPNKVRRFKDKDLPATAASYFQGGIVCWDRSVGRIVKAAASVNMLPVGFVSVDTTVANNGDNLNVTLFKEVTAIWCENLGGDPVVAGDLGGLCYLDDDHTVRHSDNPNANSVAGTVWAIETARGVLVEPRVTNDSRLGGLDA